MPTHMLTSDVHRHQLDRRVFLKVLGFAAAGALLTQGCSFKPGTDIKDQAVTQITDQWQRVALAGVQDGAEERVLISAVKDAAQSATDFGWLSKGDAVLIKPALNSGNPYPATTSPAGIRAMVELLKEKGTGRVIVSDMSGIEHVKLTPESLNGSSRELMHASGMAQAALEAGAELSFPEEAGWDAFFEDYPVDASYWQAGIMMPNILQEVDHIVLMPRCGRHLLLGNSLGMKCAVTS